MQGSQITRWPASLSLAIVLLLVLMGNVTLSESQADSSLISYQVEKKVSDFPEKQDLSTPESSYAAINRILARGGSSSDWDRIHYLPGQIGATRKSSPKAAQAWESALIKEVWVYKDTVAAVFAEINEQSHDTGFDQRYLLRTDVSWRNIGHDGSAPTLELARANFKRKSTRMLENTSVKMAENHPPPARGKIENPDAYLEPFVKFLNEEARDPKNFVLEALTKHKIVIMGEIHHRPLYWALNCSLVEDPRFIETTSTIYMELPLNDEPLIDEFLSSPQLDTTPVINMLRDIFEMGWPDKAMLDFFKTVWKVNHKTRPEKRLRIVLVDMQRPWKRINSRPDWAQYHVDRNQFMAENIISDLEEYSGSKRNALFIVGAGHAMLDLKRADNKTPMKSAGWHLRQKLGEKEVYAIFPHQPVMTNVGHVSGRLCLGLFDTAFAALNNRPVAFPLATGPFGRQGFDAMPDHRAGNQSTYADGYNAYLYLDPLENEIFSPLIQGFYTDEHIKEIDRRYQLMRGKSWHEMYGYPETTVENFIAWMSNSWGQPRDWIGRLGPTDAWKFGDNWEKEIRLEKLKYASEHPEVITDAANRFFSAIRNADYKNLTMRSMQKYLRDSKTGYQAYKWYDIWTKWLAENLQANPIVSVELGKVSQTKNSDGTELPTIPYKLTLKDGRILEGPLQFDYEPTEQIWFGKQGLDWHLKQ